MYKKFVALLLSAVLLSSCHSLRVRSRVYEDVKVPVKSFEYRHAFFSLISVESEKSICPEKDWLWLEFDREFEDHGKSFTAEYLLLGLPILFVADGDPGFGKFFLQTLGFTSGVHLLMQAGNSTGYVYQPSTLRYQCKTDQRPSPVQLIPAKL